MYIHQARNHAGSTEISENQPYPGCYGGCWLFEEVPEEPLVGRALAVAELVDVGRLERLGLLPHLLVHVLLPLVVLWGREWDRRFAYEAASFNSFSLAGVYSPSFASKADMEMFQQKL